MGTKIMLAAKSTIVLDDGRGKAASFDANAGALAPEPESPDTVHGNAPTPTPVEVRPDVKPIDVGYPKSPPRTFFVSPSYPKAPPHVLLVSSGVDEGAREVWGTGFRRTKKVLPLSVKWQDLGGDNRAQFVEMGNYLSRVTRSAKHTRVLNVFVSDRDIAAGLDVDEVRTKAKQLSPNVRGIRILYAPKTARRRK